MQFKINPGSEIHTLFSTQVAVLEIPNAADINPGLEAAVLKREISKPGGKRSNIGGWQSQDNLIEWPEPEVAELVDSMRSGVLNMVSLETGKVRFEAAISIFAWANVNRSSSYNQVHTHPHNHWSGVYYVNPGEFDEDDVANPGQLQIHDPRDRADMYIHPGSPALGKPFRVKPKAGTMVLFPSWLAHSVNIFYSETTRISIAFNAQVLNFRAQA